jgi:type I restriction enzyme M protein
LSVPDIGYFVPEGITPMSTGSTAIVQRLWNYCDVLRDDGVSYDDYVEQLTYLLFLKMADEQEHEFGKQCATPLGYSWARWTTWN